MHSSYSPRHSRAQSVSLSLTTTAGPPHRSVPSSTRWSLQDMTYVLIHFIIIYYHVSNRIYHFKVILSCPADNESAHGALEIIATPRLTPCEFNSCPAGASTGNNASDSMHIYLHLEVR